MKFKNFMKKFAALALGLGMTLGVATGLGNRAHEVDAGDTNTVTFAAKSFGNASGTGYINYNFNGTGTITGSNETVSAVMYAFNPSTGQARGNKTVIKDDSSSTTKDDTSNWHLYNTAAMPGSIRSIKVTQTQTTSTTGKFQNNLYVALGGSCQGGITSISGLTKNSTLGNTEINFSGITGDYTYFKLCSTEKFISGTIAGLSVVITYEESGGTECSHTDFTHHNATDATCTEPGTIEYWQCNNTACLAMFNNADMDESHKITDIIDPNKPALGHNYVYTKKDSTQHLVTCSRCDFEETEDHEFSTPAQEKHHCTKCFYEEPYVVPSYQKITSLSAADLPANFLIVNESSSRAFNGLDVANGYVDVVVSDGVINDSNGAAIVEINAMNGGYSLKITNGDNAGKFIYGQNNSNTIKYGTEAVANEITFAGGLATILSNNASFRYNAASGNDRFRYYKTATTGSSYIFPGLYKEVTTAASHTITFVMNDHGTAIDPVIVPSGENASDYKPADPTEEGWSFGGWFEDEDLEDLFNWDTELSQDITLYAKWTDASAKRVTGIADIDSTFESIYITESDDQFNVPEIYTEGATGELLETVSWSVDPADAGEFESDSTKAGVSPVFTASKLYDEVTITATSDDDARFSKSFTFEIEEPDLTLQSISVATTDETKKEYYNDETEVDLTGVTVTGHYSSTISEYNPDKVLNKDEFSASLDKANSRVVISVDGVEPAHYSVTFTDRPVMYTLATSTADLLNGTKVLFIGSSDSKTYGMKKYSSGNNIKGAEITIGKDGIDPSNLDEVESYTLGVTDDGYTFKDSSMNYLYAAGGTGKNNYLKAKSDLTAPSYWTITFENSVPKIVTADETVARNTMRFNNASDQLLFSCYASGQSDVSMYILPPSAEGKGTISYNANGALGNAPVDATEYDVGTVVDDLAEPESLNMPLHSFEGWSLTSDGATVDSVTIAQGENNLFAIWSLNELEHEGTLLSPFNSLEAYGMMFEKSDEYFYVEGQVENVNWNSSYENFGFEIKIPGYSNVFKGYQLTDSEASLGQYDLLDGDTVLIKGKILDYHGDPEISGQNEGSYIVNITHPKVTYSVTYHADDAKEMPPVDSNEYETGEKVEVMSSSLTRDDYLFKGWSLKEDGTGTIYNAGDEVEVTNSNINFYAVWQEDDGYEHDVLTRELTGVTGTSYVGWTIEDELFVDYKGNSAGGNDSIQLRTDNNTSGIVTTSANGIAKKVKVIFESHTTSGRTIDIYGKNTAYEAASDLYDSSKQGTLLGSITINGESSTLEIEGNYQYIGIRSKSGALYARSIDIAWEETEVYGVTYNLNGGTGEISDPKVYLPNEEVTISSEVPTKEHYKFAGWDVNGVIKQSGEKFNINEDTEIKALWAMEMGSISVNTEANFRYTLKNGEVDEISNTSLRMYVSLDEVSYNYYKGLGYEFIIELHNGANVATLENIKVVEDKDDHMFTFDIAINVPITSLNTNLTINLVATKEGEDPEYTNDVKISFMGAAIALDEAYKKGEVSLTAEQYAALCKILAMQQEEK